MNPLYNFGIHAYNAAVKVASLRHPKAAKMVSGQRQTLAAVGATFPAGTPRPLWVHAASLGEFEQARPMIERLRRERPDLRILLTFFSPSGYEVRKNYGEVDCVCYMPFDTPRKVRRFLDAVNPQAAIFVKYEFWGNYLEELRRRDIPVYLISAIFRPTQSFFRWWGSTFRRMLRCYTKLYVQDERSRELLAGIGVTNVAVAGDTRFDRVTDVLRNAGDLAAMKPFRESSPLVLIAGSSWAPDEQLYIPWANGRDDVRLIIAPHEFDPERLSAIEKQVKGPTVRFSELERNPEAGRNAKCVLIDCFGKLSSLYRYGDIAWIGGGFGVGIHNLNEAAVYGIPVVFGPNYSKFREAHELLACGGGITVSSSGEACGALTHLADDTAARTRAGKSAGEYISTHIGATDRIYSEIFGN